MKSLKSQRIKPWMKFLRVAKRGKNGYTNFILTLSVWSKLTEMWIFQMISVQSCSEEARSPRRCRRQRAVVTIFQLKNKYFDEKTYHSGKEMLYQILFSFCFFRLFFFAGRFPSFLLFFLVCLFLDHREVFLFVCLFLLGWERVPEDLSTEECGQNTSSSK